MKLKRNFSTKLSRWSTSRISTSLSKWLQREDSSHVGSSRVHEFARMESVFTVTSSTCFARSILRVDRSRRWDTLDCNMPTYYTVESICLWSLIWKIGCRFGLWGMRSVWVSLLQALSFLRVETMFICGLCVTNSINLRITLFPNATKASVGSVSAPSCTILLTPCIAFLPHYSQSALLSLVINRNWIWVLHLLAPADLPMRRASRFSPTSCIHSPIPRRRTTIPHWTTTPSKTRWTIGFRRCIRPCWTTTIHQWANRHPWSAIPLWATRSWATRTWALSGLSPRSRLSSFLSQNCTTTLMVIIRRDDFDRFVASCYCMAFCFRVTISNFPFIC